MYKLLNTDKFTKIAIEKKNRKKLPYEEEAFVNCSSNTLPFKKLLNNS